MRPHARHSPVCHSKWVDAVKRFYPAESFRVDVMTGPLVVEDLAKLDRMVQQLEDLAKVFWRYSL